MKQQEALIGIAERIIEIEPLEPESLRFSLLQHGAAAFNLVLRNLREEFSFLWKGREEFTDCELEQFERLFCWLVKKIADFPSDLERPEADLAKLLAVAATLDCDDQLWDEVYKIISTTPEWLLAALTNLIKERHADSEEILRRKYRNENHVREIVADITAKNWKSLEGVLDQVWIDYRSPVKLQATAALHRYDSSILQSLLEDEEDFFEVASYTHHAPIERALRFAVASENWTFKFWAFHRSIRHAKQDIEIYSTEWEMLLYEASKNSTEWPRWLAVLNEYPSRYPQIQEALGNALARATGWALDVYVKSISMIAPDLARKPIAVALTAFRQKAAVKERKRLWQASFNRWKEWDFGATEQSKSLFGISLSALDYPVIGYFTECLDARERDELIEQLKMRAVLLERSWYPDTTFAMTERFKLASIYQLLAQAESVSDSESDWLQGASLFKPPWEDGSLYRSLRYDTEFGKPTFFGP